MLNGAEEEEEVRHHSTGARRGMTSRSVLAQTWVNFAVAGDAVRVDDGLVDGSELVGAMEGRLLLWCFHSIENRRYTAAAHLLKTQPKTSK